MKIKPFLIICLVIFSLGCLSAFETDTGETYELDVNNKEFSIIVYDSSEQIEVEGIYNLESTGLNEVEKVAKTEDICRNTHNILNNPGDFLSFLSLEKDTEEMNEYRDDLKDSLEEDYFAREVNVEAVTPNGETVARCDIDRSSSIEDLDVSTVS